MRRGGRMRDVRRRGGRVREKWMKYVIIIYIGRIKKWSRTRRRREEDGRGGRDERREEEVRVRKLYPNFIFI
jgi:hypothetical protein